MLSIYMIQIQKGLYYSLVTMTDFEPEVVPPVPVAGAVDGKSGLSEDRIQGDGDGGAGSAEGTQTTGSVCATPPTHHHANAKAPLPPADVERCRNLMTGLVDHFTPILFTPVGGLSSFISYPVSQPTLERTTAIWPIIHERMAYRLSGVCALRLMMAWLYFLPPHSRVPNKFHADHSSLAHNATYAMHRRVCRQMDVPSRPICHHGFGRGWHIQAARDPRTHKANRLGERGTVPRLRLRKERGMDRGAGRGVGEDGRLAWPRHEMKTRGKHFRQLHARAVSKMIR